RTEYVGHHDRAAPYELRVGACRRVGAVERTGPARAPDDPGRDKRGEGDHVEEDLRPGDPRLELRRREVDEAEVEPRQQRADEVAEELDHRQLPEDALNVRHPPQV